MSTSDPRSLLAPEVLAVFGFGSSVPESLDDPRYLRVALEPVPGPARYEVWSGVEAVAPWSRDGMAGARGGGLSFGWLESSEAGRGLEEVSEAAYRRLVAHLDSSPEPHLLRVWNHLDSITEGAGDAERYRRFCAGRAAGLETYPGRFPAATAVGGHDGRRRLQIAWISCAVPGSPVENPRQVPAWRYPRHYGPRSPSFARAMSAPPGTGFSLMISGTAAVVGHQSCHAGDLVAQIDETLANMRALLASSGRSLDGLGPKSPLRAYVRDVDQLALVQRLLTERLPDGVPFLVLHAGICRRELQIEIEGVVPA